MKTWQPRRARTQFSRESTRLTCVSVTQAVTSIDPRFIRDLMPGSNVYRAGAIWFDINISELDKLPEEKYKLMEECSPINHVTRNALPTLLRYDHPLDAAYNVHHASFGVAL